MVRDLLKRTRGLPGKSRTTGGVLSAREHELATEEIELLEHLERVMRTFPASPDDLDQIQESRRRLSALFLLVVAGEFNSGKSAFINALTGTDIMPEGVTPTTAVINILTHGEEATQTVLADGTIERTHPMLMLEDITVVDTPGTNAIIREHEALTQRFVPNADIVFFVTSADRPFTESEREFMVDIREWGKKIVVVINKIDLLRTPEQKEEVRLFVEENLARLLEITPTVFPVSAMQAQQANALALPNPDESARVWKESQFGDLERYIFDTLDQEGRIELKLLSPLGTGEFLANRYLQATRDRLQVLSEDVETLQAIDRQLELHREDMRRQLSYHLTRIENIISRMNTRGDEFFEETIRIGRIFDLVKSDRIRAEFEDQVIGNSEKEIDEALQELIDWMVEQDLRTWEAINGHLDRQRLAKYESQMLGDVSYQFRYDRRALLDSVNRRAREEVERYDPERAAYDLSQSVRNAVTQVAMAEAGAIGLGAIVVAAASTVVVDVTGLLAASALAGLGLVILPRKRKKSREEFRRRSSELEERLIDVMNDQFEVELSRSTQRIESAIAPYSRFVRDQQDSLLATEQELETIVREIRDLRHTITQDRRLPDALPAQTGSD